uniref:high choriolytic enzyme 1 isoform X3 n=1 Tax=Maylandia zebra TaxID=106582 RepID=UPI000D321084|nr:high choriolytic enzyme 1 isoform X3 [Maylandia zebra]
MSCCIMWLLAAFCLSTVGSVPISPAGPFAGNVSLNATTAGGYESTTAATPRDYAFSLNPTMNTTSSAPGGATPLNYALNITSLAEGAAAPEPESSKNKSAETLKEFDQDMPVQEGDILIPESRNAVHTLWPDATTSYIITDELVSREAEIKAAFKMISDVTCIRFKKRDTESSYLKLVTGNGCASFVGCQGGAQRLFFASECTVGNLCHELLHALGLYHEHTREDRDKYVTVNWQNIVAGKENNFKVKHGNTQNLPYDLASIMHYGRDFFSTNGNPTVLPKQSGVEIGQRKHLSQLDIERLNKLYSCGKL